MKKITLLSLALFSIFYGYSQTTIDFETSTTGADWSWKVFEPDITTVSVAVIANPVSGTINTSANVIEIKGGATTEAWGAIGIESGHPAGIPSVSPADIAPFRLDQTNTFVKMMVYQKDFAAQVRIKFAGTGNASIGELISLNNAVANEWTELLFDASAYIGLGQDIDQIIILPSYGARTVEHTIYVDNIFYGSGDCSDGYKNGDELGIDCGGRCVTVCETPVPPNSAIDPTAEEKDVLYLYSDAYSNTDIKINFNNSNWMNSGSNFASSTEIVLDGTTDNIRYITDLNVGFSAMTQTDLSDYKFFHLDIWSATSTFLIIKLEGAGAALSGSKPFTLVPNQWNTINIDLDDFGNLSNNRTTVFQLVLDAAAGKDFYFDNLYFYKEATASIDKNNLLNVSLSPNPAKNELKISAENKIDKASIYNILGRKVKSFSVNAKTSSLDVSSLSTGVYILKYTSNNVIGSMKFVKE